MTQSDPTRDSSSTDQQETVEIPESRQPETDDEWFALIRREIEVAPVEADESDVIEHARTHAEQVVRRTDMTVDLDRITWRATRELTGNHGYQLDNFVKLSLDSLESNGWQEFMRVVRHELVHVWQYQNNEYDDAADNKFERVHGETFERWMPVLNIERSGSNLLPIWTLECPECHTFIEKRTCKTETIGRQAQNLEQQVCDSCGQELSEYRIKRDGEEITIESLPDVLFEQQDLIFLYNDQERTSQSVELEWDPQTRRLTELDGIGEVTARKLGDDIHCIDELLASDKETLAERVRSAVQQQYHDSLLAEARKWYQDAFKNRSGNDLELFHRIQSMQDYDWWERIECVDGTGDVESMCLLLRDEVEPGDVLRLRIEGHGDHTAEVVGKSMREGTKIGVTIVSPSLESNGTIQVPVPYKGECPIFCYSRKSSDSGTFSGHWLRKYKQTITKIEKVDG